jgi:hypothetical protein
MIRRSLLRGLGLALLALTLAFGLAAPASAAPSWNLISGQLITNGAARCTLGFNVHSGASRYILVPGHCLGGGGTWSGPGGVIGPGAGSSFPGNDYGLISVTSAAALSTPLVDRYSAGPDVTIIGVKNPTPGMSVCSSSPTTGWHCGTINAINQTVCYAEGCVTGLARSNLCPDAGASGAPVVTNPGSGSTVYAIGLSSGGSGNCSAGGTTFIQPVTEPLSAYGVTMYTG